MKKHIARIAFIMGALLLFLGSCSNFFEAPPPSADPAPQEGQGILNLSINGADARTLAPSPDIFTKYDLSILPASLNDGTGVTKTITGSFNNVEVSLDPGTWDIEITAYVGDVASVKGVKKDVNLRAGEVKSLKIILNQVVESDVAGTFVYDIAIPSTVAQRLDTQSKVRDPYGIVADPSNGLPFPNDEFNTSGTTANQYFSGAILRIIPDVSSGTTGIVDEIENEGYVILDLLYGDESPGNYGNNNPIDPKRYSKGRIELSAGRYHLYLSLVSDRAIGTVPTPATADYIGIFKEEVVYIYPKAETATPASYKAFADTDMDAQVYFEGHTSISPSDSGYTAVEAQVSRDNYPSHYYENAGYELWTAPIDDDGNWRLYIPSWELAEGTKNADQGHLDYDSDTVYFRFKMTSGSRTLYSPWQAYVTREKQGQIDLDLYATIETLTLIPNSGTMTVKLETGHEDSIVASGSANVYDVVRGVNFSKAWDTSYYVEDVLITVTPPAGKAIASFDPKDTDDINWSYADEGTEWNEYYPSLSMSPTAAPTQNNKPVVYVIDNYQAYSSLNHTSDNSRPSNSADLGNYAVNVSARYFDFRGSVTMNLDHMPNTVNAYYVEIFDVAGSRLIDRQPLTKSGSTFLWDFDPQNYLPVYHYTESGDDSYYDYDIYNYSGTDVDFGSTPYDSNGVRFQFVFEDTTQPPGFEEVARTQMTRKYTAPELVGPIQLGISSTLGVSDASPQQFTANGDLPGRDYSHGYSADYDAQYYYFFSDPDTPYTVEYQEHAFVNDGLTDVDVSLYDSSSIISLTPVATVSAYPVQAVYGSPNGSFVGNVVELITVEITRQPSPDSGNGYKLKIEPPEDYTVTTDTTEETKSIRDGTRKYYRFTPTAGTPYYSLFQDASSNPAYANITVNAYRDGSASATTLNGNGASYYEPVNLSPVILEIIEGRPTDNVSRNYTFRVATPTTLSLGTFLSTFNIRQGTNQYYRVTPVTPGSSYNLIFSDTADVTSNANVSVQGIYSDGTFSGIYPTGDNATVYAINPPSPGDSSVILKVTETTLGNATRPFGIKLYP